MKYKLVSFLRRMEIGQRQTVSVPASQMDEVISHLEATWRRTGEVYDLRRVDGGIDVVFIEKPIPSNGKPKSAFRLGIEALKIGDSMPLDGTYETRYKAITTSRNVAIGTGRKFQIGLDSIIRIDPSTAKKGKPKSDMRAKIEALESGQSIIFDVALNSNARTMVQTVQNATGRKFQCRSTGDGMMTVTRTDGANKSTSVLSGMLLGESRLFPIDGLDGLDALRISLHKTNKKNQEQYKIAGFTHEHAIVERTN